MRSNFIELCARGEALLDEIDDFVDAWHQKAGSSPIYSYLGMTKLEYSLWVADPDVLPFIVTAHRENRNVEDLLTEAHRVPMAARADGPEKAIKLMKWLKQQGLWE